MKKYLIFVLIGMMIMTTVPAGAGSIGSPETEGKGKIGAGAEWAYVFNRDLDFESATRPPGHEHDKPENFKIDGGNNVTGEVSYGLFKALDVYVKLGVANYNLKGDVYVRDIKTVEEKLSAGNAFLYGGGLKFAYELKDGWIIGGDVQYLTSDHELDFKATNLITGAVVTAKYADCRMQEWQAAPYIAKKIASFTPYLGVRYSGFRMDQKEPNDPKRWDNLVFEAESNFGVFVGTDYNFGEHFRVNVEGRFIDETAMSVSAIYRF